MPIHLIELVYDFGDKVRTSKMDLNPNAAYEVVQPHAQAYNITLFEKYYLCILRDDVWLFIFPLFMRL